MTMTCIMTYEHLRSKTPVELAGIALDENQMHMNRHTAWEALNSRLPEFNGMGWVAESIEARASVIKAVQMTFSPITGAARV